MNKLIKRQYFTLSDCNISLQRLVDEDPHSFLLITYLNERYEHNWIIYKDVEVSPWGDEVELTPDDNKIEQWTNRFKYIYENTKKRYLKLIDLYSSQEDNLLNKLGSSTTTKFNDTPQNVNVGDTDEYTSTVTKVSTEVEPGELMDRLNKIHSQYKNLYNEWVYEFNDLFGENTLI